MKLTHFAISVLLVIAGCSSAGRVSIIEPTEYDSWKVKSEIDPYSNIVKVNSFHFENDSISIHVKTNQYGDLVLAQPWEQGLRTILFGPPFIPIIPNPIYLLLLLLPERYAFTLWIEFQPKESSTSIDIDKIQFYRVDSTPIIPTKIQTWEHFEMRWRADSAASFTLTDTLTAVSFSFTFTEKETDGFGISFPNVGGMIPALSTKTTSKWFYQPISRLSH